MKPDPRSPQFWDAEEEALIDELTPSAIKIFFSGGLGGEQAMPANVQALLNWDVFNQAAIDWIRKWQRTILHGINETTKKQVVQNIVNWVQSGRPLPALIKEINAMGAFTQRRATQIAVTEVTRMYAEGNIEAWKATGHISGMKWQTANDEKVCPICAPLHGMIADLDGYGFTTEEGGEGITAPPAHVNCRCFLLPVVSPEAVREARLKRLGLE